MNGAIENAVATLELAPEPRARLARYIDLLLAENRNVNLTGSRDAEAVLEHVRDSLTLAPFARGPLVDVGSGGGFPAIPLAIVTGITVTLIEATAKKACFLEAVCGELGLDATVIAERAEVVAHDPAYRERFASGTARAIASAPVVLELTMPFLAIGGLALLQRGTLSYAERTAAQDAAAALGGGLLEELEVPRGRILVVAKRRPTPERFPRRPASPNGGRLGSPFVPEPDVAALDEALAAALPPGSVYAVGGRVRDEIRADLDRVARPAKDLDYVAVGLTIEELLERLGRVGRADVVGAAFAVVKWTSDGVTVDVALPRRERSTGAGHRDFVVEAGPDVSIEDDLARRDFRMNMLARRLEDGRLVDPYDGEADIRARRIDLLRPEAFDEDPLRMLRAAQFAARFEYAVTPATMEAMRDAAPLVKTVSPERIHDELVKLLSAPRPSLGFEVMREGGLLGYILPEIAEGVGVEQNEYHRHDVYVHTLATLDAAPQDDLIVRLAALLHDVAKPRTKDGPHFYRHEIVGSGLSTEILSRLRFPNETIERVSRLVRNHMFSADPEASPAAMRRFARRVGLDNLTEQFALRAADVVGSGLPKRDNTNERFEAEVRRLLSEKPALTVKDLAIGGEDVIAAAVAAGVLPPRSRGGPVVGAVLQALLDRVIEEPKVNDREALLKMLPRAIQAWNEECSPGNKR